MTRHEQTDSDQLTLTSGDSGTTTGDEADSADTATTSTERGPTASTSSASSSNVTEHRDPSVGAWVTDQRDNEETYGFFHLFVLTKCDLDGTERRLCYEKRIDHPALAYDAELLTDGFGYGGVSASDARDQLVGWKLGKLARPFHPELRIIPARDLRVFVADPARELLREHGVAIDALVDQLNRLDEHTPSEEQLAKRQAYAETLEAVTGASTPLKQRVRAIEATIRARFGFSARYGHTVPGPHPEYRDLELDTLRTELESARDDLEQTKQRKEDLQKDLTAANTRWVEEKRATLFE